MTDVLALIGRQEDQQEWISWQKEDSILSLPTEENTACPQPAHEPPAADDIATPAINRSQYQAVMQRFNHAAKNANRFTSWTNS